MKPYKLSLALFLAITIHLQMQAQSFKHGDIVFSGGFAFGTYNTKGEDPVNSLTITGDANGSIIPLTVEIALSNNFGFGAGYRSSKYPGSQDTANASGKDYDIFVRYHFLTDRILNCYGGVRYGVADFHYKNTINQNLFDAQGGHLQLELGVNIYVFRGVGVGFNISYDHLHYPNGTVTDPATNTTDYKVYLNGPTAGLSVLLKL